MSLESLLSISQQRDMRKIGISEERLMACLPELRKAISFYRAYPDIFIDHIKGPNSIFKFYTYQRVFLRAVMRHKFTYFVYPRGYSKSFLTMLSLILKAIFYPGSELFVTTGGKEQAASITIAKIEQLCTLIPPLNNEINWDRGASKKSKDSVEYIFKNGSKINILAARESSRGQRRTGGVIEEAILIDETALNEIVIPTTNIDRLLPDGTKNPDEVVNKSQTYITTAGYKNTFAYDKLKEMMISSLFEPKKFMIMGGTFETPVHAGLLDENFVDQLRMQGTFNEASFDREYRSKWGGDADGAFFSAERFDKHRVLLQPEYEYSERSSKQAFYTIGVDVGRKGCNTEVVIIKSTPQQNGSSLKSLVNLFAIEDTHFEDQAIYIKKLYYKYKARAISIDGNGLGIGLIDYMVKQQIDPETGDTLPDFGVINDDEGFYKKFKTPNTETDAMFIIKANAPINTEAYSYTQTQIMNGKIKFLIKESEAKVKLLETKKGQNMDAADRSKYLQPFTYTSILQEQMSNLVEKNEGLNIILDRSSTSIKKDKFSAFIYGLYFIKKEEERRRKRHGSGRILMLCN